MMVGENLHNLNIDMPGDAHYTQKDLSTFSAYLAIIVRDSNGKVVKVHRQRSHSPTKNLIQLLIPVYYLNSNSISITIVNTSNSSVTYLPATPAGISYPSNQENSPSYLVMIQVGSGSQSNPYDAYSLAAPIADGTGTGQLVYGTPSISTSIMVSESSAYFYINQAFNNLSGGTVTITEVGIITQIYTYGPYGGNFHNLGNLLVWYDVLSSSISVPNGGSVVIYYTFVVNP